jgi:hypothetical protein
MGHLIWALPLGAIIHAQTNKTDSQAINADRRPPVSLAIILAFLPVAYGLGSYNPILITTAFSAYFILLAGLAFLRRRCDGNEWFSRAISLSALSLLVSAGILYSSLAHPYRQPYFLWLNDYPISLKKGTKEIYLHRFVGISLDALRQLTEENGFVRGNVFIDLSGRAPGTTLVVGGLTPGTPWIISGASGSQAWFRLALRKIPCPDLAKAWLLWDTKPPARPLDPKALLESGLDPDKDFNLVGFINHPIVFQNGTIDFSEYLILKPNVDYIHTTESCFKSRNINQ